MQNQTLASGTSFRGESKPGSGWHRWTLKTLGVVALVVPVTTVNGFLFEVSQIKASLGPGQTFTLDWDLVPGVLIEMGLVNLVSFPFILYFCLVATFAMARALGGQGSFWPHGYEVTVAYLKAVLWTVLAAAIMAAEPSAQCLGLGVLYIVLKLVSGAIGEVHGISPNRGFVALLPLVVLIPITVGVLLLLGPILGQTLAVIAEGLSAP